MLSVGPTNQDRQMKLYNDLTWLRLWCIGEVVIKFYYFDENHELRVRYEYNECDNKSLAMVSWVQR